MAKAAVVYLKSVLLAVQKLNSLFLTHKTTLALKLRLFFFEKALYKRRIICYNIFEL